MSAERSLPSLFTMLTTVDAVHGTYYFLLHFWVDLFGASELSVRLPSAIAVGFATAGTVVLARQLFSSRVAVIAGVICIVLPRFTYMGSEARSYALSTAIAVWLTVLLVHLLHATSTRRWVWIGYGLGLAAGIYVFLFLGLLVLVHGAAVVSNARARAHLKFWMRSTAIGLLLALPLVVFAFGERHQIAFLAHRTRATFSLVVVGQWFGDTWFALASWSLILAAVALAARSALRARRRGERSDGAFGTVLLVSWLLIPTLSLLAANALVMPIYTNRYLSFSAPAAALLVGLGVSALARQWMRTAGVAAIIALAVPSYLAQRTEFGKPGGSDWAAVAGVIESSAHPGDAIVYDQKVKASWRPRLASHMYPESFKGLNDVALLQPFDQTSGLWDRVAPLVDVTPSLVGVSTVWALETTASDEKSRTSDLNVLQHVGFSVASTRKVHRTIIYELVRSTQ